MNLTFTVIYKNGKKITFSNQVGYDSIPRNDIIEFEVKKDEKSFILIKLDDNAKLIYRKRVEQTFGKDPIIVYIFGWRKNGEQSINYLLPDGSLIQSGKFKENDPLMYSPKLRECEI